MISGVYKIESLIKPERIYIGSAIDLKERWYVHLSNLRKNKHHNIKMQNHFNKYGESDLIFVILEVCIPYFTTSREQHYIDVLNPWFNICKTAGSTAGIKKSEITIQRMKDAWKRRSPMTDETKRKISKPRSEEGKQNMRKKHNISEESHNRMRMAKLGKKQSKETIEKRRQKHLGRKNTEETILKMKESKQRQLDTNK